MSKLPDGYSEVPPESDWFGYTTNTNSIEKKYRLRPDEYHQLLAEQEDRCAICRRHPTSVGPLYVDHDHDHPDERVRGLVCNSCNLGLGHFKNDPDLLLDACQYLLERGSAATRERERLAHEPVHPEVATATTRLELHFLDGSLAFGAVPAEPRLGLGSQTFDKYDREWRVSERKALPPESGLGAELLVCYEVGP